MVVGIEDVMAKEVRECNARGKGGGKEGDGDREREVTIAGDLEGFEEGARNGASHRQWRWLTRLEEDEGCSDRLDARRL
ncbi:hypothetical protein BHM03_00058967 [Ensete ventricosum]|nr:hypothetical protein BHM03_00058967 [Ensete ventricosum]